MNIIRDENQSGFDTPAISMIPLFVSWGVNRCNVEGCASQPTTIISATGFPVIGMCEAHYKAAEKQQKFSYKIEFNSL